MNEKIILSYVADTDHKVERFSKSYINIEITKDIKINKTSKRYSVLSAVRQSGS